MMLTNQSMDWQGKTLGRYRMVRLLGRGGMGEVWLADDTELRRQVAVKLLPSVLASDKSYLHAFEYEARAAAALEHPNILPVHDFGEQPIAADEIITYLIMPYITGGSLRDRLRSANGPLPIDESLRYLRQAAQAIDYAHSRQVLHRDIKPANMLLQREWLFIADFGLAKLLTSSTLRSKTHTGSGTPEYMAPEQAQGHAEPASDRYSLAMTAYQLFTGVLPFRGETPYSILIKQVKDLPPSPQQFNPAIPQEVEAILMRGLAKSLVERPTSCMAFVEALERAWITPTQSQRDPDATVLAPWSKRLRENQEVPQLPFSATPPPVTPGMPIPQPPAYPGSPVPPTPPMPYPPAMQGPPPAPPIQPPPPQVLPSAPPYYPAPPAAPTVHSQYGSYGQPGLMPPPGMLAVPTLPEQQRKVSRRQLLIGGGTAAAVAVAGGASFIAWQRLQTPAPPAAKPKPVPGPQKLIPGVPLLSLTGHSRTVYNALWDPTGRYLATTSEDQTIMVWDVKGSLPKNSNTPRTLSTPLHRWKFSASVLSDNIAWSYDGRGLIYTISGDENKVYYLDVTGKTKDPIMYFDVKYANNFALLPPTYTYVAASPTGDFFATSLLFSGEGVRLWQLKQKDAPVKNLKIEKGPPKIGTATIEVDDLAWSPDGSMVLGITNNFEILAWDVKTGTLKYAADLPTAADLKAKPTVIYSLRGAVQWSPASPTSILMSFGDTGMVWDIQHDKKLAQLTTDDPPARTPPKNPDTGFGIPWTPNVVGLTWSPNGRYVAGCYGRSHHLYVWDLQVKNPKMTKEGKHLQDLIFGDTGGHNDTLYDIRWSPDGRYLASASFDSTVIVWKVDGA